MNTSSQNAKIEVDAVYVMETVATFTDGPEPNIDAAKKWLVKHWGGIEDAMYHAAYNYIQTHWNRRME